MDSQYPLMLYTFPGNRGEVYALQDGSYGTLIVADVESHEAAMADGWFLTPANARQGEADRIAAAQAQAQAEAEAAALAQTKVDEVTPPTREELEAKATELNIPFRSNTSDKALSDRIAAALEA